MLAENQAQADRWTAAPSALREQAESPLQRLVMHTLRLVTDVMVDDVSLAERMRMAVLSIWLAEKHTQQQPLSDSAWREIQRGEEELLRQLSAARCYMGYDRFDQTVALLGQAAQYRTAHTA